MFNTYKALMEDRGALLKKMNGLTNERGAKFKRLRALAAKDRSTSREQKDYEKLKDEIRDLDTEIEDCEDQLAMLNQQVEDEKKHGDHPLQRDISFSDFGYPDAGTSPEPNQKLLRPDQKFARRAGVMTDEEGVTPGQFLRAAMFAPKTAAERTAIQNSVTSSGYTLPTGVSMEIIDMLREINPVIQAGARSFELDPEDESNFVSILEYPDAVWHEQLAEEDTDAPVFGKVTAKAKTLLSLFEVSRELEQDSLNIEDAIRTAFVGSLNDAIVAATFTSPGANAPVGLNDLVGDEEEYSALSYGTLVAAQQQLFGAHVPKERTAVLHSPDNWGTLNTLADATTSQPIEKPAGIRDIPEFVADGVPSGISYTGDFSNLAYGFRHEISIERHPSYSAKKFGALWLAFLRLDLILFRPSALVRIQPEA